MLNLSVHFLYYLNFSLHFQKVLVGALFTPKDEGVLITSLVKKLQKDTVGFFPIVGGGVVYCLCDLFS